MTYLPEQPASVALVLDSSFKLFIDGFYKLIGLGFLIGISYLFMAYFINSAIPVDVYDAENFDSYAMESIPTILGLSLLSILMSFIFYGAIIFRIDNIVQQREDSFMEALRVGVRKLPAMIFAVILYAIVVTTGFILLLIPGVILSLSLVFYPYFILLENAGAYSAVKSSHKLVWGDWWRTMTVFMVPSVVILILYFALGLVLAFTGDMDALTGNSLTWVDYVTNLASAFVMPFFYVVGYVQYYDLKLRKSGSDLAARMS